MTQRSGVVGPPADHVVGSWPHGRPRSGAPTAVTYAQQIAHALADALEGRSIAAVAKQAGLARSTIYDLMSGRTWPDFVTLVKLEEALELTLWPCNTG